jgi:hypothetical protein
MHDGPVTFLKTKPLKIPPRKTGIFRSFSGGREENTKTAQVAFIKPLVCTEK